MHKNTSQVYPPPVDLLLEYGEAASVKPENWPDYLSLGIGPEHIPDLLRLATDFELHALDGEQVEIWAPLHAWRALGQLHAEEAAEPLLWLLDHLDEDDDWTRVELPMVYQMIGPAALPALTAYIADTSHRYPARTTALEALEKIIDRWPDLRAGYVAFVMEQLERMLEVDTEEQEDEPSLPPHSSLPRTILEELEQLLELDEEEEDRYLFTSFLVNALERVQAQEAAPLIKKAFAMDRVDVFATGEWEDVQIGLGLLTEEEAERMYEMREIEPFAFHRTENVQYLPSAQKQKTKSAATQKKAKRKMRHQTKKKQRK